MSAGKCDQKERRKETVEESNIPKKRAEPTRHARRIDSIRLDENDSTYWTKEGYLVDHPILTSVGIFQYVNPDGSTRRELRLPEYVFDEESLKTYRGKPIIITHSAGRISKNNVGDEQIGTILSAGYQDGDDVRAEIIIHDTDSMESSGLRELSLGYSLDLIEEPGEWEGQHYDAIQSNIRINHLALVRDARAGDQARLNIDGSDEPVLKGGKCDMKHNDSIDLTPEELLAAVKAYRDAHPVGGEKTAATVAGDGQGENPVPAATMAEKPEAPVTVPGKVPEASMAPAVKDATVKEEAKDGIDVAGAVSVLEQLISVLKGGAAPRTAPGKVENADDGENIPETEKEPETGNNGDGAECGGAEKLNTDSADEVFRQRLGICRMGDKLRLDGLEEKTIEEGKRAIIEKVLPDLRLDGKGAEYINAAYDLACESAKTQEKFKTGGVEYQRRQMNGSDSQMRNDGTGNKSMAASARQRMLDRENAEKGGNN